MSAQNLIDLAVAKGYRIGRKSAGVYYFGKGSDEQHFHGSWTAFVAHVKAL
jgi:hypothetical protein